MSVERKTLVCASFKVRSLAQAMRDVIQARANEANAVEFRLEEFSENEVELKQLEQLISFAKARQLLTIATCRNEKQCKILQAALAEGVDLVDVDLRDLTSEKLSVEKNRLIASHHDFNKTPSTQELIEIVNSCFAHAQIAKVACMVNDEADNERLLSLYSIFPAEKLVSLGMGLKGSKTRLAAFQCNAFLSYACLSQERATALGQFTVKELVDVANSVKNYD